MKALFILNKCVSTNLGAKLDPLFAEAAKMGTSSQGISLPSQIPISLAIRSLEVIADLEVEIIYVSTLQKAEDLSLHLESFATEFDFYAVVGDGDVHQDGSSFNYYPFLFVLPQLKGSREIRLEVPFSHVVKHLEIFSSSKSESKRKKSPLFKSALGTKFSLQPEVIVMPSNSKIIRIMTDKNEIRIFLSAEGKIQGAFTNCLGNDMAVDALDSGIILNFQKLANNNAG